MRMVFLFDYNFNQNRTNYIREGTLIPNKRNADFITLPTLSDNCTLNILSSSVSAPKIETF